ncbi:MAG: hypothetical protein ABEN55_00270 [Bradymonadaceae bacterium]
MPKVIDRMSVTRYPDEHVTFSDGECSRLEKVPRDELEEVVFFRMQFGDLDSLDGIMDSLFIWVEASVASRAFDNEISWQRIVRVVLTKGRPALPEDFNLETD